MYFEDYVPGVRTEHPATITVDQSAVIEFAEQFDPQYVHLDPEAAAEGPFKGLVASGWHTAGYTTTGHVGHLGSAPERDRLRAYTVFPVHYLSICTTHTPPRPGGHVDEFVEHNCHSRCPAPSRRRQPRDCVRRTGNGSIVTQRAVGCAPPTVR